MNYWYTPDMFSYPYFSDPQFSEKLIKTLESEAVETTCLYLKTGKIKHLNHDFTPKITNFNNNLKKFIFLKCQDKELSPEVKLSEIHLRIIELFEENVEGDDKEELIEKIRQIFTQIQKLKSSPALLNDI